MQEKKKLSNGFSRFPVNGRHIRKFCQDGKTIFREVTR